MPGGRMGAGDNDRQLVTQAIYPTSATADPAKTLALSERVVIATTGTEDCTITLPGVEEAEGLIFSFRLATDGTGDLIIKDESATTLLTMVGTDGYYTVYSDGYYWNPFYSAVGSA